MNHKKLFIILLYFIISINYVTAETLIIDRSTYTFTKTPFILSGTYPNTYFTGWSDSINGEYLDNTYFNIENISKIVIYLDSSIDNNPNKMYIRIRGYVDSISYPLLSSGYVMSDTAGITAQEIISFPNPINVSMYDGFIIEVQQPNYDGYPSLKVAYTYNHDIDYLPYGELLQINPTFYENVKLHERNYDLSFQLYGNLSENQTTPTPTPSPTPTYTQPVPTPTTVPEQTPNTPTLPDENGTLPPDTQDDNFTIPNFSNNTQCDNNSCVPSQIYDNTLSDSSFGKTLRGYGYCTTEKCTIDDGIDLLYDFSITFCYISFFILGIKCYIIRKRD